VKLNTSLNEQSPCIFNEGVLFHTNDHNWILPNGILNLGQQALVTSQFFVNCRVHVFNIQNGTHKFSNTKLLTFTINMLIARKASTVGA
jgi:hypothetical protein